MTREAASRDQTMYLASCSARTTSISLTLTTYFVAVSVGRIIFVSQISSMRSPFILFLLLCRKPDQLESDATPRRRFRIKSSSLVKKGNITKKLPEPLDSVPQDHESEDFDCSITSALTVSPTKSSSGMMDPTPTEDLDDTCAKAPVTGLQRPKKRKRRLFTGTTKGGKD